MQRRSILFVCTAALLSTSLPAADHTAFDGTWILDAAQTKSDGGPVWKSRTLTMATEGETRKFTSSGTSADGQSLRGGYEAKADGKDYPMSGHIAGGDTIALRKVSTNVMSYTLKKAGKVITTGRTTVSADGKTMTLNAKGTTADGKPYTSTFIYKKQ